MKLTQDEEKAVKALKRVAKKWPKSLWLFSASGTLTVMKKNSEGKRAIVGGAVGPAGGVGGGVDPEYIVDSIGIENDGGDW